MLIVMVDSETELVATPPAAEVATGVVATPPAMDGEEAGAEAGAEELAKTGADEAMTGEEVTTLRAGQLVTVGAHEVMVISSVE